MLILAERIEHFFLTHHRFAAPRNQLLPNRTIWVVAVDQVEEIRGDRERQLLTGKKATGLLVGRERHMLFKLGHTRDSVLQLPHPVAPI